MEGAFDHFLYGKLMGNARFGFVSKLGAAMRLIEKLIYGVSQRVGVCRWYGQSRYDM